MGRLRWIALLLACSLPACKRGVTLPDVGGHADAAGPKAIVLPGPRARRGDDVTVTVRVELRADGTWFDGVAMADDAALSKAARAVTAKEPHVVAEIIADPTVPYARVIHAMDLLRAAGLGDVSFGPLVPEPTPMPRDR